MFPIRDNIPSRTTPWVNYAILWLNVGVWAYQLTLDQTGLWSLFLEYGIVPAAFEGAASRGGTQSFLPFVSSMFLHGGWLHIIGNLWMLWIFGDNVEDFLGHGRYAVFYVLCGVAAGAVHLFTNWGSPVPTIGASGAIAGVMGAYILLYPRALVLTYVPLFVILLPLTLPAVVFIGIWFVMQFASGAASLLAVHPTDGGVAWWAHVGGFLAGMALVRLMGAGKRRNQDYRGQRSAASYRGRRRNG